MQCRDLAVVLVGDVGQRILNQLGLVVQVPAPHGLEKELDGHLQVSGKRWTFPLRLSFPLVALSDRPPLGRHVGGWKAAPAGRAVDMLGGFRLAR